MYLLGAIILLLTAVVIYSIKRARRARKNKRTQSNDYNGFHLGEMTKHDVPEKFSERRAFLKYTGHYYGDERNKEGTKNEKDKQ